MYRPFRPSNARAAQLAEPNARAPSGPAAWPFFRPILFCWPNSQNGPAHFIRATPGRTQAATWAWAGKSGRPRAPAWAASPARASGAVGADRTATRRLRVNKTRPPAAVSQPSANPSGHLHSRSLSLRLTALPSLLSQSPSERQRREQAASPGAVAGPLAGVRAPQRVSAPPSSGLAAAPLWPDPGEPCPPAGLSFPRAPA